MTADPNPLRQHAARIEPGRGEGEDKPFPLTPEMFGAVGDGVTDDTAAIQAALDYGGSSGKAVGVDSKPRRIAREVRDGG